MKTGARSRGCGEFAVVSGEQSPCLAKRFCRNLARSAVLCAPPGRKTSAVSPLAPRERVRKTCRILPRLNQILPRSNHFWSHLRQIPAEISAAETQGRSPQAVSRESVTTEFTTWGENRVRIFARLPFPSGANAVRTALATAALKHLPGFQRAQQYIFYITTRRPFPQAAAAAASAALAVVEWPPGPFEDSHEGKEQEGKGGTGVSRENGAAPLSCLCALF